MPGSRRREPSRWTALLFIALAQLIIAIDVTVVNIAMPTVQADLGMSDSARQWIVAAYTLAFGGLLLFGGRVVDRVGARRTFVVSLGFFAVASAIAGAAESGAVLIAGRVLQGLCGAVLSPSALALVTTTFTEDKDRAKAFGIYSAVASAGLAAGLIVGGLVTEFISWRWVFYLSVPSAVIAAVGVYSVVPVTVVPVTVAPVTAAGPAGARGGRARRPDVAGALLSVAGLVTLVLALAAAGDVGVRSVSTLALAGSAVVLLAAFIAVEARAAHPLLPLRLLTAPGRAGVYLAVLLAIVGMFGLFLLATFYLQVVHGFTPMQTGLAFLPLVVSLAVGATQISGRLPGVSPRLLMSGGFVSALGAMLLLTRLSTDSGYLTLLLPAEVLLGLGLGMVFVPATNLSTSGVAVADSGVASALYVTVQQLGAAVGTVVLNSVAAAATARYALAHAVPPDSAAAIVSGFRTAIWWAVLMLAVGLLTSLLLVGDRRNTVDPAAGATAEAGASADADRPV